MIRRPPISTRTDTLFPYATLFRSLQVAEQLSDYLLDGGITNALNVPSLSAEEAPKLKPYMALAEELGSLVGQLEGDRIQSVSVEGAGHAAELNQKPTTAAVLEGLTRGYSTTVHLVIADRKSAGEGKGVYVRGE